MNNKQLQARKWLPIGWKMMAAYGVLWMFFAILVPISSYFILPNQPKFLFGPTDEKFTGVTWDRIMSLGPDFGLWVVLTMVSMCAMMMAGGILTFMIANGPYREGKRWAWRALVFAHVSIIAIYYILFIGGLHLVRGIPFWTQFPGASGLGSDLLSVIFPVWLYFGLWLPRKELKD